MSKPPSLGTIWPYQAKIVYIDDDNPKWVAVSSCLDTPNAIRKELERCAQLYPERTLWVKNHLGNKIGYTPLGGIQFFSKGFLTEELPIMPGG